MRDKKGSAATVLINAVRIDDAPASATSAAVNMRHYGHFALSIDIDSTGVSTHEIQVQIQVSIDEGATFQDLVVDFWGHMIFDDVITASGLERSYEGKCGGHEIRAVVTGTNTTSSNFFDVTVAILPFNT